MSIVLFAPPVNRAAIVATAFTLSMAATGANGVPVTVTVTPNGTLGSSVNVILSVAGGGTLALSGFTFPAGSSAAQSTTLTRTTDGTSTVTMSNDGGLGSNGTPATFLTGPGNSSWLIGMAVNEWKELLGTKLSDQPGIDTGVNSSKQDAWCGWHKDELTSRIISGGQGGHADYLGNEINVLDFRADTPAWSQITASSLASTVDQDSDYGTDGKPKSIHGYHTSVTVNSINKGLRFFGGSRATRGTPYQRITAFDLTTGAWDAEATWSGLTLPVTLGAGNGAYAKHPTTEKVYCWIYNSFLYEWDPTSPTTLTTLITSPPNPAPSYTAAACDPTRGTSGSGEIFFLGGGSGGTMCRVYDIGDNSLRSITLTGADISVSATGCALEYVPALDKYIVCIPGAGGSSVYVITPNTGTSWACAALSTTGGGTLPATNGSSAVYPFTKFLYLPALGVAVFGPRWGHNVWALKLHEV